MKNRECRRLGGIRQVGQRVYSWNFRRQRGQMQTSCEGICTRSRILMQGAPVAHGSGQAELRSNQTMGSEAAAPGLPYWDGRQLHCGDGTWDVVPMTWPHGCVKFGSVTGDPWVNSHMLGTCTWWETLRPCGVQPQSTGCAQARCVSSGVRHAVQSRSTGCT